MRGRRPLMGLALAVVLALGLPRAGWSQCDLPLVATEVVIDSSLLAIKLDEPARLEAARDAARSLADEGGFFFPFFCWAQSGAGPGQTPAAKLVLTVGNGALGGVSLSYGASIGGVEEDLSAGLGEELLYRVRHTGPAQSKQLQTDIAEKVHAQFENEAFRQRLKRLFIAEVPLLREARVQPVERILVPVDEARLKAGEGTQLRITLTADGDFLVVRKEGPCRRGRKGMLTLLESLSVASLSPSFKGWHPSIPTWLDDSRRSGHLVVYMKEPQWEACLTGANDDVVRVRGAAEPPACNICRKRQPKP